MTGGILWQLLPGDRRDLPQRCLGGWSQKVRVDVKPEPDEGVASAAVRGTDGRRCRLAHRSVSTDTLKKEGGIYPRPYPHVLPSSGHVPRPLGGRGNQGVSSDFDVLCLLRGTISWRWGESNPHAPICVVAGQMVFGLVRACFRSFPSMPFKSPGSRRTASNACHRVKTVSSKRA